MDEQAIKDEINNLRRKMLVHSYLYYSMNESVVSDSTFDRWAKELVRLHIEYPEIAEKCAYANDFKSFDGTTGYHLPRDEWVERAAKRVLVEHKKITQ